MKRHDGSQLPAPRPRAIVYLQGRPLAVRWEGDDVAVQRYYRSDGLFAERHVDRNARKNTQVRAFTDAVQLRTMLRA